MRIHPQQVIWIFSIFCILELSGCKSIYYQFTGKMSPEYAAERGRPECANMTPEACTNMAREDAARARLDAERAYTAQKQKEDENIILAGMAVCDKVGLPRKCIALLEPSTIAERYAAQLGPDDRVNFEMARSLYFEIKRNSEEARRSEAAQQNAASVSRAIFSSGVIMAGAMRESHINTFIEQSSPKTINCQRIGQFTNCTLH